MVIRPLRIRTSNEDYQEFSKMMKKSASKKRPDNYQLLSFRSGIGFVMIVTTVFVFTYKGIYERIIVKNSSQNDIEEYNDLESKNELKESDWMTKSIFRNEIKSNKNEKS